MVQKQKQQKERKDKSGEFRIPDFDEDRYIKDTGRGLRIATFAFLYGIVIAFVSRVLWGFWGYPPAFIIGLFAIVLQIAYFRRREEMKPMDWFSSGALYVLTWLGFWILFTNPPF
jgi:4-hydroxybenzoate polyprenyltransferase